ncbi:MAG: LCP family protein [Chloroflexota bacterium]|jgi:polyisoprenyl-teichoic acid--peptidoglycan teichoic acid transferase
MTSESRKPRRSSSGVRLPLWALALLILFGLLLLILSSAWLFSTVRGLASNTVGSGTGIDFVPLPGQSSNDPSAPVISEGVSPSSEGGLQPESIPAWAGSDRINVLLLGVDLRCDESGPTHSDTIIVASIDPISRSGAMLSIPRDLWVEIPGYGVNRINQAYFLGQAYEYPGGGPQLARETVEAFLGIPLDYHVAVDFKAVVDFVDVMGGIILDVPEGIVDPNYPDNCYGYDPFTIEPGRQRLDGATALKYARTRATFGGDIDRAERQQAVVLAVRDQALQLGTLSQLILKANELWQSFQENVDTDLRLDQILQLARLAQDIPQDRIRSAVLDFDYVYNDTTFDGQQVLVPLRDQVRILRDELFAPPPVPTPVIEALPTVITVEDARVGIYNGTPTFGLAADTQQFLLRNNVNVTEIGNADAATYSTTQIIDYGSHPGTVQYLIQLMSIPPLNVSTGSDPAGDFDVLVILGSDWQLP